MGPEQITAAHGLALVPFHFWSAAFFVLGCVVGSFLNVCIYRLPRSLSIVWPPSHCPSCSYSIPWYLNIPLISWLVLRGRCRNCGAGISFRYFVVELLTGTAFLLSWVVYGRQSVWLVLVYCVLLSGLIVASFIDAEHLIIPDQITLGGACVGVVCSLFVPALHGAPGPIKALERSFLGAVFGAGLIFVILHFGKLVFGRQRVRLPPDTKVVFTETALVLPDKTIPYEEVFYRESDTITLHAKTVELIDRCYWDVDVRLKPVELQIGNEQFNPEEVLQMETVTDELVLPREAMGFGDVKFMAAIGTFVGWQGVGFALMVSSLIGSVLGVGLVLAGRRAWSSRMPYGPFIAMATAVWIFGGRNLWRLVFGA